MTLSRTKKIHEEHIKLANAKKSSGKSDAEIAKELGVSEDYYREEIKHEAVPSSWNSWSNYNWEEASRRAREWAEEFTRRTRERAEESWRNSKKQYDSKPNSNSGDKPYEAPAPTVAEEFKYISARLDIVNEELQEFAKLCKPTGRRKAIKEFCEVESRKSQDYANCFPEQGLSKFLQEYCPSHLNGPLKELCVKHNVNLVSWFVDGYCPSNALGYLKGLIEIRYLLYNPNAPIEDRYLSAMSEASKALVIAQIQHCAYVVGARKCHPDSRVPSESLVIKKDITDKLDAVLMKTAQILWKSSGLPKIDLQNSEISTLSKIGRCLYSINQYELLLNLATLSKADNTAFLKSMATKVDMCAPSTPLNKLVKAHFTDLKSTYETICGNEAVHQCFIGAHLDDEHSAL